MGLLDDVQAQVSTTWDNVTSAGAPAIIAGAENYAAQQLTQAATQSTQASQAAVNQIIATGGPSSGLMASIQGTLSGIAQGTFFKSYGLYIVIGGIALLVVGRRYL